MRKRSTSSIYERDINGNAAKFSRRIETRGPGSRMVSAGMARRIDRRPREDAGFLAENERAMGGSRTRRAHHRGVGFLISIRRHTRKRAIQVQTRAADRDGECAASARRSSRLRYCDDKRFRAR